MIKQMNGCATVTHEETKEVFSFFDYIFWYTKKLSGKAKKQVRDQDLPPTEEG